MPNQSAFTSTYLNKLSRKLINKVIVSPAIDNSGNPIDKITGKKEWNAQWDTGATDTCISKKIAQELGLGVVSQKIMQTPSGKKITDCYAVHILLPNHVEILWLCVLEAELVDCDVLIGMDIIGRGDFAVSNYNNSTVFTFRIPSAMTFDFVKKSYLAPFIAEKEQERNAKCSCGSEKKYKNCCGKDKSD